MTKGINSGDIGRINPNFQVKDFRQMVNYQSGTNKGYVRFTRTSNGGLKLEKINNKIDVPLSWRSNVGAENNRIMRQKFVNAMSGDLKYVGETQRNKIRDMVLTPRDKEGKVQTGKALSRRDIKAALEVFDRVFNTPGGRRTILDNFFKAAMAECGFRGAAEEFKRDYLRLEEHGLDAEALLKYCEDTEGAQGPAHERMVKSEVEFRSLIGQLERMLDLAKLRCGVETGLKDLARECIKKGDCFGLNLLDQGHGKLVSDLRATLTKLLAARGIQDVDVTVNGSLHKALDTFFAKVLPFYLQEGVANARDFAGGDPAALEEALEANFDFGTLEDLAAEFVQGAAEAATKPNQPLDAKEKNALSETLANVREMEERIDIYKMAGMEMMQRAALKKDEADQLGKQVSGMADLFRAEAAIDNYAARFVLKHFARGAENMKPQEVEAKEKVKEFVDQQLVPALQLQYGERWKAGNAGYVQGGNAQNFIKQVAGQIGDVINQVGGGRALYENLFSYTLPNILNQRIEKAALSKGMERLHLEGGDGGGLDQAIRQINRTAVAYRNFRAQKMDGVLEKTMQGYQKLLAKQVKKGNLNDNDYVNLQADFRRRLQEAGQRAIQRFFERSPLPIVHPDDLNKDAAEGVKLLTQLLDEERNAVIAEMTQRLNIAVLGHSSNFRIKQGLMDAGPAVNGFIDSLTGRQPPLDPQLTGPALRRGLERLYVQVLHEQLKGRKVSKAPVDDKFAAKVQEAFTKAANDFVKKAESYGARLEETLRKVVAENVRQQMQTGAEAMRDNAKLGKAEQKAVVDALTNDVMLAQNRRLGALKARYLEHPEVYAREGADEAIDQEFSYDESRINIHRAMIVAAQERIVAVAKWLGEADEHGQALDARLQQAEALRLRAAHPGLSAAEVANLSKAAVAPVIKRINDFPMLFSIGGKDGFTARVNQEVQSGSDQRLKVYTAFREQFLKAVQPSLDKYSSLTQAVLDKKLAMTLEDFSKAEKLPDLKVAVRAFDKMLSDTLNGVLDKNFAAYMEYSQAVTDAYENAIPVLNAGMEAHLDELKEAGATDADIQFFRETLAPRLREQVETEICKEPKQWLGQAGKDKAAKYFADTLAVMKRDLGMMRLDPGLPEVFEENLSYLLDINGFNGFMADESTKAVVLENVKTWVKGDSVQQLFGEVRRALMTSSVYGRDSGTQAAREARAVFEKFHAGLRAAVVGIQATILQGEFRNTQLEPALKLFEIWLEKYDLPTLPISRNGKTMTLKEMAMEHFTQRVKDLQQRMLNEGTVAEPLLSREYLTSFLQFINEHGTSVMLLEMEEKVKAEQMARLTGTSRDLFELDGIHGSDRSKYVREAVAVNHMGLRKLLDMNMKNVEAEMRSQVLSIEELQRWREVVEERFAKHVRNTNSFRMACETRVVQMQQLSDMEGKAPQLLLDALKERFGGEDILSSTKISDKTRANPKLGGRIPELVNMLMGLMAQKTAEKIEGLQRQALKEVSNPLKAQAPFLHDTDGNPALTNSFKALARELVKGACDSKEYRKLFTQLDKELGTSAK